jgi:hypothetical protein
MLRDWTPQQLLGQLEAGAFDEKLSTDERAELTALLQDWTRRALGMVMLRDALWVDAQRGARVYSLICRAHTLGQCSVPRPLEAIVGTVAAVQTGAAPLCLQQTRSAFADSKHITALLDQAEKQELALAGYAGAVPHYPFPASLETLLPDPPAPYTGPPPHFEQPLGLRRALAISLVFLGAAALGIPLLLGQRPVQPAGLPLGLFTLALLLGIRAGWTGYAGSFCIWLVPNLPGFHYGTTLSAFLHAFPLLLLGLVLLTFDSSVRNMWRWLMWRWVRQQRKE